MRAGAEDARVLCIAFLEGRQGGTTALRRGRAGMACMGASQKNSFSTLYKGLALWGNARRGIVLWGKGLPRFFGQYARKSVEIWRYS
jgi:hypothetical protein